MKKYFFYTLLLGLVFGNTACLSKKVVVNREVDTQADGKMLLGEQQKSQLLKQPYSDWYNKEKDEYVLNQEAMKELKSKKLNSYNITVFLGTWCEDSHRDIPRLMKILETLKYPETKLRLIAVNRKYESPGGEEGLFNIQRVPTIIISKYGKEIGRMVEYPETGVLEKDLVNILKKDHSSLKDIFK